MTLAPSLNARPSSAERLARRMRCLEVRVNDDAPWIAGIENASLLTVLLGGCVGEEAPASLRLAGMCDLENDRRAHVHWLHELPLHPGDRVSVALVESDHAAPPAELKPTDAPEYLEEQRQYLESEASWQPPAEPAPRLWPSLRFRLSVNGLALVRPGYAVSQEHFVCSFDWDRWRPDRLRMYARAFSGAFSRPDHHHTDWLRANLELGEVASIDVDA